MAVQAKKGKKYVVAVEGEHGNAMRIVLVDPHSAKHYETGSLWVEHAKYKDALGGWSWEPYGEINLDKFEFTVQTDRTELTGKSRSNYDSPREAVILNMLWKLIKSKAKIEEIEG